MSMVFRHSPDEKALRSSGDPPNGIVGLHPYKASFYVSPGYDPSGPSTKHEDETDIEIELAALTSGLTDRAAVNFVWAMLASGLAVLLRELIEEGAGEQGWDDLVALAEFGRQLDRGLHERLEQLS